MNRAEVRLDVAIPLLYNNVWATISTELREKIKNMCDMRKVNIRPLATGTIL